MGIAVETIGRLRKTWAALGLPVFFITLVHEADGSTLSRFDSKPWNIRGTSEAEIIDELRPEPHEIVMTKHRYSAFFGTDLALKLKEAGIGACVITGYQARACVLATALDAYQLDLKAEVVENAVLDTDQAQLNFYLAAFRDAGILKSVDEIVAAASVSRS